MKRILSLLLLLAGVGTATAATFPTLTNRTSVLDTDFAAGYRSTDTTASTSDSRYQMTVLRTYFQTGLEPQSANLDAWSLKTAPSGTVADLTSAQTFSGKTINGANNTLVVRPQDITQSGATTNQVLGWNGSAWGPMSVLGSGDMLKSVYDTNADNIVDHAALADATPWSGITGKPTTAAGAGFTNGAAIDAWGAKTAPSGTVADLTSTQTFSGKTINGASNTLVVRPQDITQSGATTNQVIGWNGTVWGPMSVTGAGDMLKSVYDTNADNIVDHAALADAVPWSGVSSKPTTAAGAGFTNGASIDAWGAKTAPTGTVADLTSTQTFSGKTINGASNTLVVRPQDITQSGATTNQVIGWNGTVWGPMSITGGSLPSMTGNAGKYLTNDGTTASWNNITASVGQTSETVATFSTAGQSNITRASGSNFHTAFLIAGAGSGTYTRVISLLTANSPASGNEIRAVLSLPASANPTVEFHNITPAGTLLATVTNPPATATQVELNFLFDGTNWNLVSSTFVASSGSGVTSVAGKTGVVTLVKADITDLGTIASAASKSTVTTSAGAGDSGKVPLLDSTGKLDSSVIPAGGGVNATQIQGINVANTTPTSGQVLAYNSTNSRYEPVAQTGGGGLTISSNTIYYASTSGSDSNDGLSSGAPKTLQGLMDLFEGSTIKSGITVTCQLADGTYSATNGFFCRSFFGGGSISLKGNTGNASSVVVQSTDVNSRAGLNCAPASPCIYTASYLTINSASQYTACLLVSGCGQFQIGQNLRFPGYSGSFVAGHIQVEFPTASLTAAAGLTSYIIAGGSNRHMMITSGAHVDMYNNGNTIALDCGGTANNFATCWVGVERCSTVILNTYSATNGSITGSRYSVAKNGVLDNIGAAALPGNSAGSTTTGGQFSGF